MLFGSIPGLVVVDTTTVAASRLGRLVVDSTSKTLYLDNGTQWVPVSAAGTASTAGVTLSDTPPASPTDAQLWWDTSSGNLKIYLASAGNWIDAFTGKVGPTGPAGAGGPGFIGISSSLISTTDIRWAPYVRAGTDLTTLAVTANQGYYIPFYTGGNTTFTRIGFAVTTALSGTAYCALYADTGTGAPGNLIVASAGLSTGATGDILGTVASTTLQSNTLYW